VKDYLTDFLMPGEGENLETPKGGQYQKAQKVPASFEKPSGGEVSKGSKGTFEPFDTGPPKGYSKVEGPDAGATPDPEPEPFTLTPEAAPERPRLGSCARPRVLLGTKMPKTCPYHTCGGELSWRGYTRGECTLAYCKTCDTWWGLQPDTPGVYVGDLADNDPLVEVDLHDQKPPRYARQSALSNWPPALFNDRRKNHA
jgi:hypothetical protein